ncbi:biotin-dependent carboxyltransferase family protein [Anaerolentibacter hominis]|uniref:5-oxoprolinase subunit C family protein n=1 Tax=Anaerolentibacter hominis TaxID=3079009 RepID=UPI0031B7FFBE
MSIFVRSGGLLTTVQDEGRYGYQQYGVMVSGPMDERAFLLANILVGNDACEAELEVTLMGPILEFEEDNIIAVTGADLTPVLNGNPFPMYEAVTVRKGDILSFQGVKSGCRAYIAFAGGLDIPLVMGSRSTLLRAGFGGFKGRKLEAGDRLPFRNPAATLCGMPGRRITAENNYSGSVALRVVPGPQEDRFTQTGLKTFFSETYQIGAENDRMGYRLEGPAVEHKTDGNIITDGIAMGAVQIPSGGKPIIMMADRQCTGGYTKIANVIRADLPRLAQCKTGDRVRFVPVTVEEAQELFRKERRNLRQIRERLSVPRRVISSKTFQLIINGTAYSVQVDEKEEI